MAPSSPDICCHLTTAPERKADLPALGVRGPLVTRLGHRQLPRFATRQRHALQKANASQCTMSLRYLLTEMSEHLCIDAGG
jgi:hypothetical protein